MNENTGLGRVVSIEELFQEIEAEEQSDAAKEAEIEQTIEETIEEMQMELDEEVTDDVPETEEMTKRERIERILELLQDNAEFYEYYAKEHHEPYVKERAIELRVLYKMLAKCL
jgi:DNA primase catalytic subunit